MQDNTYSLWLRPSQTQIDELTKIISRLAHQYRRRVFPPHITLLSSIKSDIRTITSTCEQITESHPAFDIRLGKIDYTKEHYRNLYILAEVDETLTKLYNQTKIKLEHTISETFIPHVSLLYGNLDTKKQQQQGVELSNSYAKFFNCQRLDLYNASGKESEWYLIQSYYFT